MKTALGPIELDIPRVRRGNFYPERVLERYSRVERALIWAIQESYILGVSTRKMSRIYRRMGLAGLDRSTLAAPQSYASLLFNSS